LTLFAQAESVAGERSGVRDRIMQIAVPLVVAACGDIFMAAPNPVPLGAEALTLVSADFNGDGLDDVAAATAGGIQIALASERGGFTVAGRVAVAYAGSLLTGDFDSDGRIDLVATSGEPSRVVVGLGDGTGGFRLRGVGSPGERALLRAAADFNGDGHSDLVLTTRQFTSELGYTFYDDVMRLLLGDGTGGFAEAAGGPIKLDHYVPAPNPDPEFPDVAERPAGPIVAAHVNGDAHVDVLVAMGGLPGGVQVLLGDGAGNLHPGSDGAYWRDVQHQSNASINSMAVADFDEDGQADVAVFNGFGREFTVLHGDGVGGFGEVLGIARVVFGGVSLAAADFDADGHVDVAIRRAGGRDVVTVLLGDGDSRFVEAPGSPELTSAGRGARGMWLATGRFDRDPAIDLATASLLDPDRQRVTMLGVLRNTAAQPATAETRRLPLRRSRAQTRYGSSVTLYSRRTCGEPANGRFALYNRAVTPRGHGQWQLVTTETANRLGEVSEQVAPAFNTQYQWRPADGGVGRASRPLLVRVAPLVRAHWEDAAGPAGMVVGRVRPARPGGRVELRAYVTGRPSAIATMRQNAHGRFQFRLRDKDAPRLADVVVPATRRTAAGEGPVRSTGG
jgi:hypothetical protein